MQSDFPENVSNCFVKSCERVEFGRVGMRDYLFTAPGRGEAILTGFRGATHLSRLESTYYKIMIDLLDNLLDTPGEHGLM